MFFNTRLKIFAFVVIQGSQRFSFAGGCPLPHFLCPEKPQLLIYMTSVITALLNYTLAKSHREVLIVGVLG